MEENGSPSFEEFVRMSPVQRIEYVKQHGLSIEQRKELLQINRLIASLFQQDAYWAGKHGRVERTLRFQFRW
jgi:hypothetical protein